MSKDLCRLSSELPFDLEECELAMEEDSGGGVDLKRLVKVCALVCAWCVHWCVHGMVCAWHGVCMVCGQARARFAPSYLPTPLSAGGTIRSSPPHALLSCLPARTPLCAVSHRLSPRVPPREQSDRLLARVTLRTCSSTARNEISKRRLPGPILMVPILSEDVLVLLQYRIGS